MSCLRGRSRGFTLNWTATDATASIIGYLAMGAVYSPGPGVSGKARRLDVVRVMAYCER